MWNLENAQPIINQINTISRRFGYFVCLYGSVLYKGYSDKDMDLQIISFLGIDNSSSLITAICKELNAVFIGSPYEGLLNTSAYGIKLHDGRIIDIVIRTDKFYTDGHM